MDGLGTSLQGWVLGAQHNDMCQLTHVGDHWPVTPSLWSLPLLVSISTLNFHVVTPKLDLHLELFLRTLEYLSVLHPQHQ